jgi:hypothetical protein
MTAFSALWAALSDPDKYALALAAAGAIVWALQHTWAHSGLPGLWPDSTLASKAVATAILTTVAAISADKLTGIGLLAAWLPVFSTGLAAHLLAGQGVCGGGAQTLVAPSSCPTTPTTAPVALPVPQPPPTVTPIVGAPKGPDGKFVSTKPAVDPPPLPGNDAVVSPPPSAVA